MSVIALVDAWQDAGGEAATTPLIRLTRAGLQGEEMKGEEREGRSRGRGKIGRRESRRYRKRGSEREERWVWGCSYIVYL